MKPYEHTLKTKIKLFWYRYFRPVRVFINTYIKRRHMLDMRNKLHGYPGGYIDPSEQIFYANFAILKNFVEREKPFDVYDLKIVDGKVTSSEQGPPEQDLYYQELYDLYNWWTVGRQNENAAVAELGAKVQYHSEPTEIDPIHGQLFSLKWTGPFNEWIKASDIFEARDQEMLERLIKLRKHLWT